MPEVPEEVRRLAAERDERRRAKDFAEADRLRDEIAALGFRVIDAADGPTFEPIAHAGPERPGPLRPQDVVSALEEPATMDVSVHLIVEGWPEDVVRALDGFRAGAADRRVQYVVTDVTGVDPAAFGDDVEVVSLVEGTGWGAARNAGLKRSRGRTVLVVDGSVEPTGDVFGPLEEALADDRVGVCGPFGVISHDLREFEEASGVGPRRAVDAIEGYLMAFRRDVLVRAGLFDERFKWYRTADIELSFRVRDLGLDAVVVEVPLTRHEHRMWFATPAEDRARWSKRNYYRFLDRFRGRSDLLVAGEGAEGGRD